MKVNIFIIAFAILKETTAASGTCSKVRERFLNEDCCGASGETPVCVAETLNVKALNAAADAVVPQPRNSWMSQPDDDYLEKLALSGANFVLTAFYDPHQSITHLMQNNSYIKYSGNCPGHTMVTAIIYGVIDVEGDAFTNTMCANGITANLSFPIKFTRANSDAILNNQVYQKVECALSVAYEIEAASGIDVTTMDSMTTLYSVYDFAHSMPLAYPNMSNLATVSVAESTLKDAYTLLMDNVYKLDNLVAYEMQSAARKLSDWYIWLFSIHMRAAVVIAGYDPLSFMIDGNSLSIDSLFHTQEDLMNPIFAPEGVPCFMPAGANQADEQMGLSVNLDRYNLTVI